MYSATFQSSSWDEQVQIHPQIPSAESEHVATNEEDPSTSAAFLHDFDSMLNDSTDFPFTSALSGDSSLAPQLNKTPEKLLRSIPPNSMQVRQGARRGGLNHDQYADRVAI